MAHPKHFLPRSGQFEDDDQHRTLELDATPIARADRPATTTEVTDHALPPLQTHVRRKWLFGVGITVAFFDLCVMPNVYFYALKFGTKLTLQYIFAVITGLFGLFCFIHYCMRSFKLFLKSSSLRYRPLGWTRPRWAVLEFFHVNIALVVSLFETELVVGTAPTNPILRLCAMPPATICFYFGFVFLLSSIFTALKYRLPFNMSSTPKGCLWRPALYAFVEDFGAIDLSGEQAFRKAMMQRYETRYTFRRMIQTLSWCWGVGFLVTATVATVLIMVLPETVGFGVGWVTPFICAAVMATLTVVYVKRSLRQERAAWGKGQSSGSCLEMGVP